MTRQRRISPGTITGALFFAVVAAAFALAVFAPAVHAARHEGLSAGRHVLEGREVAIYNIAGELRVIPGKGSSVVIEVTTGGKDGEKLTVSETVERGLPTLRVQYPEDHIVYPEFGFGPPNGVRSESYLGYAGRRIRVTGRGPGMEAHADLVVSVPRGKRVHLNVAVGPASIRDVEADLSFKGSSSNVKVERTSGALAIGTGSGTIEVTRSRGPMSLDTGSGDIDVSESEGTLSTDAGSGSVSLRRVGADHIAIDAGSGTITATDVAATAISADCGSGEVNLDGTAADRIAIDAGSGSVRLRVTKHFQNLVIQAGSGSVRLEAPRDLSASLSIECPRRQLHIDFPLEVEVSKEDKTVGRIGSGRGKITIDAGSGRVDLVPM